MTQNQAIKLTAEITADTIAYMAERAGLSVADTFAAILAGGNARKQFDQYMAAACEAVA